MSDAPAEPTTAVPMGRLVLYCLSTPPVFAALLLWPAGRWDWMPGWHYVGLFSIYLALSLGVLLKVNPAVIVARMRLTSGTKTWDKWWGALSAPVITAVWVVAALDAGRYGWGPAMPGGLAWVGLGLFVPGSAIFLWAMAANPFFEKTVRIQTDRGHRVITDGPYRWVRHPGYVGFGGWIVATPLLLGSWWAFAPAALSLITLVVRTALEDRTLRRELDGYAEYAARVRYRLVPGVW